MEDFNKGLLSGRISKKSVRRVNSKSENNPQFAIANINLAVNYYNRKTGNKEAMYFPVTVLGRDAEFIEKYMNVGDELYVIGEWRPNEWVSKSGEKHREFYLEAKEIKAGQKKKSQTDDSNGGENKPERDIAQEHQRNGNNGFYPIDDYLEDDKLPF